uniref:Lipocalin/cytosolic fatty-acid binding domain-containing protein n=1 Tax=Amphiprion ocellaris TaxID=80972 RepID=A0AAQ5XGT4_AMPOC
MHTAVSLVFLLILGSVWTLQVAAVLPESQANFDLDQFMGSWYELAVVSNCPHYMQHKRENPVVVALELKHAASEQNFTMTATTFRSDLNDSCKETSTVYSLTDTPGRFFHHFARFAADIDSFVVHTNYNEFAVMLQLSTEKPSETKTTKIKLYSKRPLFHRSVSPSLSSTHSFNARLANKIMVASITSGCLNHIRWIFICNGGENNNSHVQGYIKPLLLFLFSFRHTEQKKLRAVLLSLFVK